MKLTDNFDVICIGAALIDMVARVERHPDSDDEVFVGDIFLTSGGAAANTASACALLGLKASFLGKIGINDTFSRKIIEDFEKSGVDTTLLRYTKERGTGSAYIALDARGQRRIYAFSGAANLLNEEDIIPSDIIKTKSLFLSSLKNIAPFIAAAKIGKKYKIPVILNPGMLIIEKGLNEIRNLLENVDIFILSRKEIQNLLKIRIGEFDKNVISKSIEPLKELGITVIVITLGDQGALLISDDQLEIIPAFEVNNVIDTTGAGDAFSAGFIYSYVKLGDIGFENLKKCVHTGNYVASQCIQKLGARNGIPDNIELNLDPNASSTV
jgi:ribokinase